MAIQHTNRLAPVPVQQQPPQQQPAQQAATTLARQPIEPNDLNEIMAFAQIALKSNYFGVRSVEEVAVRILYGRELGLSVIQSMMGLTMIQGRLTISAGTIAARVKQSGKYDYKMVRWDNQACELQFYENGKLIPNGRSIFTMQDARSAQLVKQGSAWEKYTKAMLFSRALTQGVRAFAPDIFLGPVYTPDEVAETDPIDIDLSTIENTGGEMIEEAELVEEAKPTPPPAAKRKPRPEPVAPVAPPIDPPFDMPADDVPQPIQPLKRVEPQVVQSQVKTTNAEHVQKIDAFFQQAEREFEKRGYVDMTAPGKTCMFIYKKLHEEGIVPGQANSYRTATRDIAAVDENWEPILAYLKAAAAAVEKDLADVPPA